MKLRNANTIVSELLIALRKSTWGETYPEALSNLETYRADMVGTVMKHAPKAKRK